MKGQYLRALMHVVLVAGLLASCGESGDEAENGDAQRAGPSEAGPAPTMDAGADAASRLDAASVLPGGDAGGVQLSEQQVLGVITAIDEGEIELGMLVQGKATTPQVRQYAANMLMSCRTAQDRQRALGVNGTESPTAQTFRSSHPAIVQLLQLQAAGQMFDFLYIETQLMSLTVVLDLFDQTLLPGVRSQAVRAHVMMRRAELQAQMDEGLTVRGFVSDAGAAAP